MKVAQVRESGHLLVVLNDVLTWIRYHAEVTAYWGFLFWVSSTSMRFIGRLLKGHDHAVTLTTFHIFMILGITSGLGTKIHLVRLPRPLFMELTS